MPDPATHVYEVWDGEKREEHRYVTTMEDAEKLADLLNTYYDTQSVHVQPRFTAHSHKLISRDSIDNLEEWLNDTGEQRGS